MTLPVSNKTEIKELIERCRAATGPDRELDAAVWLAFTNGATRKIVTVSSATGQWPPYTVDETRDAYRQLVTVPSYSASIDAALALVARTLPDTVRPGFQQNPDRTWNAAILRVSPDEGDCPCAVAHTAPLAILSALLQALQEEGK